MMHTSYNPALVVLSIAIAIFASYTALDLGGRVRSAGSGPRWGWISAAALAMGGGIWSMHFIGMLAFDATMPVTYDVDLTILSFGIAVATTGAAFARVARKNARRRDVAFSGPLMGFGVASMHYTGMAAMRGPGGLAYSLPIVALSVAIAITAASTALWLTFRHNSVAQKLLAASVMGIAVAGMHYTGMAAATFTHVGMDGITMGTEMGRVSIGQQNVALYVAGATLLVLFLAILASSLDQQRIARDLTASQARFRAAAEAVSDLIWTNDATGEMRPPQEDWAAFTGQTETEYDGHGWAKAVHPEDIASTMTAWNSALANRQTFVWEHRLRRQDGVYRLFSVRAVPVLKPDGRIHEWVGVHEDITERRESERALEAARDAAESANRAKSTFIANMSHELRTPLSAIIGYSEMMLEELQDGGDAATLSPDMKKIENNARHLLGLINDVLDLSKIESGRMEVFAEFFDIETLVRDVAASVQNLVTRRGNRLTLDIAPDLGRMHSDQIKVRQALLNLLGNAAKFTEGGTVTLDVSRQAGTGDTLLFRVTDTGIGMTADQVAKLFQRFTQADASTTRRYGGTGLGLSLTKAFADMLGGSVSVESTLGQGSSFTLVLPVAAHAFDIEPSRHDGDIEPGNLVIVVDDDEHQRALLVRFLAREGFETRTAADGDSGLELIRLLRPRAVLLDVAMPGLDGWAVLTALKADPAVAGIPVVMVTFTEQKALAASLGASDYIVKPVRWERLKSVMDRVRADDVLDSVRRFDEIAHDVPAPAPAPAMVGPA